MSISLDEAVELTRTGDLWVFRGRSVPDRAIQLTTNSPVNHVGMAVVLDDMPPLMWHAELGRSLPDLWTGTHQRGVQLHDLRDAVCVWGNRYGQRGWLRQIEPPADAEMERSVLRTIARLDGTPFPSTAQLAWRWLRGRVPSPRLPLRGTWPWRPRTAPRSSRSPTRRWVCCRSVDDRAGTTRAGSGAGTTWACTVVPGWAARSRCGSRRVEVSASRAAAIACGVTASTDLDLLTDFFDRYGVALTVGDVPAIAGCYALPGLVVADTYSFSFNSPAAVALSFVGAAPDYTERELVAAHADIEQVQQISALLVEVAVRWEFLDSQGRQVPGERYRYLLRSTEQGLAICTVVRTG